MKKLQPDIVSFNQLYRDFEKRFMRFANSYVKDESVAEDITIDSMLYYWENRDSLNDETNVPAYILTTIKSKCLNYLRHERICENYSEQAKAYYEWELNTRINTLEACEPYELLTNEIQELVDKALNEMPEKTRKVFTLNRYEDKTYKEIALLMGISDKGVDFHIQKALKLLRKHLKDYFPLFLYYFL